jgi:hypothetical protein
VPACGWEGGCAACVWGGGYSLIPGSQAAAAEAPFAFLWAARFTTTYTQTRMHVLRSHATECTHAGGGSGGAGDVSGASCAGRCGGAQGAGPAGRAGSRWVLPRGARRRAGSFRRRRPGIASGAGARRARPSNADNHAHVCRPPLLITHAHPRKRTEANRPTTNAVSCRRPAGGGAGCGCGGAAGALRPFPGAYAVSARRLPGV